MAWLFVLFYFIPAALVLLAFWAIWRLIRLFDLSVSSRRTLFVVIGTFGFAPIIAPAGLSAAWVPHGLAVFSPPSPGYYVHFSRIVFPSFACTAVIFSLLAWRLISTEVRPLKTQWNRFVIPILVFGLIFGAYSYIVPDTEIPDPMTTDAIESEYGDKLDTIVSLPRLQDKRERTGEIQSLKTAFEKDDTVLRVSLQDPGRGGNVYGQMFHFVKSKSPPSRTCWGNSVPSQAGLKRCLWKFGPFDRMETLEYQRSFKFADETLSVTIEFDLDLLLDVFEDGR